MNIGDKYMHRSIPGLTCTILDLTKKGIKVQLYIPRPFKWIGKRDKIEYFHSVDFRDGDGVWIKI